MFSRCGPAKSRRPQGYAMTARLWTGLGAVIHCHVIRLQMRAEGGQRKNYGGVSTRAVFSQSCGKG